MRTRVGYAGGITPSPTYHRLGDHTETLQVDYDPARVSFEALLAEFWSQHDATAPAWSRQYNSAIWTTDDAEYHAACVARDGLEAAVGRPVLTDIRPLESFHLAEGYHQKYRLRGDSDLYAEFRKTFPGDAGLVDSTAAARVNGFIGGEGSLGDLMSEIDSYGLSVRGRARLVDLVEARTSRLPGGAGGTGARAL